MALTAGGSFGKRTVTSDPNEGREFTQAIRSTSVQPSPTPTRSTSRSTGGSTTTRRTTSGGGGGSAPAPPPPPAPAPQPTGPTPAELERQRIEEEREQRRQEIRDAIAAIAEQPLDPGLVAQFAERQRGATRGFQEAEALAERERGIAGLDFEQFVQQLGQQRESAIGGLMQEASARNLAFQPAFVGVGQRDIRDQAAEAQALAEQRRGMFLSEIQRQVNAAEAARQQEMAAIEREEARARAAHEQFIRSQQQALQGQLSAI